MAKTKKKATLVRQIDVCICGVVCKIVITPESKRIKDGQRTMNLVREAIHNRIFGLDIHYVQHKQNKL